MTGRFCTIEDLRGRKKKRRRKNPLELIDPALNVSLSKAASFVGAANTAAQRQPGAGGDNDSAAARLCIVALCSASGALIWSLCECVGNGAAFPVL